MGQDQAWALGRGSDDAVGPRWEFAKNRRRDREAGWEHAGRSIEEDRKTHYKNAGDCQIGGNSGGCTDTAQDFDQVSTVEPPRLGG
ncbi:hypothetical protein BHE74_00039263 [Ensete ventricosum]|nr:hypothetical protein BHE74_00039263 [Ensete ventricosum]